MHEGVETAPSGAAGECAPARPIRWGWATRPRGAPETGVSSSRGRPRSDASRSSPRPPGVTLISLGTRKFLWDEETRVEEFRERQAKRDAWRVVPRRRASPDPRQPIVRPAQSVRASRRRGHRGRDDDWPQRHASACRSLEPHACSTKVSRAERRGASVQGAATVSHSLCLTAGAGAVGRARPVCIGHMQCGSRLKHVTIWQFSSPPFAAEACDHVASFLAAKA